METQTRRTNMKKRNILLSLLTASIVVLLTGQELFAQAAIPKVNMDVLCRMNQSQVYKSCVEGIYLGASDSIGGELIPEPLTSCGACLDAVVNYVNSACGESHPIPEDSRIWDEFFDCLFGWGY